MVLNNIFLQTFPRILSLEKNVSELCYNDSFFSHQVALAWVTVRLVPEVITVPSPAWMPRLGPARPGSTARLTTTPQHPTHRA